MKYLSFITALILLATLFSFVFTQLNKDETKHEYGIAFPLEESESRLPPLSSVIQSEVDAKSALAAASSSEATTTTETIATSSSGPTKPTSEETGTSAEVLPSSSSSSSEDVKESVPESGDGTSIVIEAIQDSIVAPGQNETSESDSGKDSSAEDESSGPSTNPKLVFIERLMGLNFQRAPAANGFSSFLSMDSLAGSQPQPEDDSKNSTTKPELSNPSSAEDQSDSKDSTPESLGTTLEGLRSRWENRIRKFTFPFQNSYSVVLRASSLGSGPESQDAKEPAMENSDNSVDGDNGEPKIKNLLAAAQQQNGDEQPKYYFQSASGPIGGQGGPVAPPTSQNPSQANQLLRMAALSMMSKLFTALRNQDSASTRFTPDSHSHHHHHDDHDLEDDDEESDLDSDRTIPEGLPMPIIIAHRPRINIEGPGYGYGGDEPALPRAAVMYGRPSALAYQQSGPQGPPQQGAWPQAALQAAVARAIVRQLGAGARRMEAPEQQLSSAQQQQPQRLILLIQRPSVAEASSPRVQIVSPRDEQNSYPQPMFHYAPLSPPSSPILYQSNRGPSAIQRMIVQAVAQAQIRQQLAAQAQQQAQQQSQPQARIVEVPVPMYVPMQMRMRDTRGPRPLAMSSPRMMMAQAQADQSAQAQSGPGHVAVVYLHNSEQESQDGPSGYGQPQAVETEQEQQQPAQGFIRLMLRGMPRQGPLGPIGPSPIARMAFHRRLDEESSGDDSEPQQAQQQQPSPMIAHDMIDGPRLRQWRDYSQFVRSAPVPQQAAPVAHLLIATRSEDPEAASSEENYQHQQPIHMPPHPFYQPQQMAQQESGEMSPAQHMMAFAHPGYSQQQQQAQQGADGPRAGPHAAFFIVAEPHGAQQEGPNNNQQDA